MAKSVKVAMVKRSAQTGQFVASTSVAGKGFTQKLSQAEQNDVKTKRREMRDRLVAAG